jgi:membrane protein implicated in regulation of membrane protease activity
MESKRIDFIQHTVTWCKGEIFEGRMILLFGLAMLAVGLALWLSGTTPNARAMVVPALVVSLLSIPTGFNLSRKNARNIEVYQQAFAQNPDQFVQQEKERTENFIQWYPYTRWGMAAVTVIGLGLLLLLAGPPARAIGLGLIILAFAVLVIDHFSEERASTYHRHIVDYQAAR